MITAGLNSERDENKSAKNITFIPALFSCFRTLKFFVLVDIWVTDHWLDSHTTIHKKRTGQRQPQEIIGQVFTGLPILRAAYGLCRLNIWLLNVHPQANIDPNEI